MRYIKAYYHHTVTSQVGCPIMEPNNRSPTSTAIQACGNFHLRPEKLLLLEETINECAEWVFQKHLHSNQVLAILHLFIHRRLLLELTIGSGKSTVVHVTGMVLGGFSLIIVPLPSLGSDQVGSMNSHEGSMKRFVAVNLDEIKTCTSISSLSKLLISLPHESRTVYLYASPHTLD